MVRAHAVWADCKKVAGTITGTDEELGHEPRIKSHYWQCRFSPKRSFFRSSVPRKEMLLYVGMAFSLSWGECAELLVRGDQLIEVVVVGEATADQC